MEWLYIDSTHTAEMPEGRNGYVHVYRKEFNIIRLHYS